LLLLSLLLLFLLLVVALWLLCGLFFEGLFCGVVLGW
jgi:hypothetical protein